MRKTLYLLLGILLAISLGVVYFKLSSSSDVHTGITNPVGARSDSPNYWIMVVISVACWLSAFVPLPTWLSVSLSSVIVWIGLAVMSVTGIFVYLNYPNNTLENGEYAGFLCGIAMVTSRLPNILRIMYRQGGS